MKLIQNAISYFLFAGLLSCASENSTQTNAVTEIKNSTPVDTVPQTDTLTPHAVTSYLDSLYLQEDWKNDSKVFGYKDRFGKNVIRCQYEFAGTFYKGIAPVIKHGKSGFIDTTGKMIVEFKEYDLAKWHHELAGYDELYTMNEGMYLVTNESGKFGYVNAKNELIIPIEYDWGSYFSEGKTVIEKNGEFGFIDSTGNLFGKIEYDQARPFSEGLAAVKVKGKFGFIDHSGTFVIEPKYKSAFSFSDGLCAVSNSEEYTHFFFIDKTGKIIIEGPFDNVDSFKNGECVVEKRGKSRVIDLTGKELRKLDYDYFAGC